MEALRNLPSRGVGFTRVGFGLEPRDSDPGASPTPRLESPLDLPGVAYDSAGNLRGYVCDHNAAPPAHQYITTDATNVLIRLLTQKRSKDALAGRGAGASTADAPRVDVGSSDRNQKPRGPPGLESRRGCFPRTRSEDAATAAARRPATTGLERATKRPNTARERVRVADETTKDEGRRDSENAAATDPASPGDSDLPRRSVAELRAFLRARGVFGAAVDIASKPQLLVRARTILRENAANDTSRAR